MSSFGSPSRGNNGRTRAHPYSRPSSNNGDALPTSSSSTALALQPASRPNGLTHHTSHVARRSVTPSTGSSLTRSGSAPSLGLIGGLKSMISKPFSWIATPSRNTKRDHSPDVEESASPSADLPQKRARRRSPSPTHSQSDHYAPPRANSLSRASEGRATRTIGNEPLPALPLTLTGARTRSGNATNFSRPLSTSQSMGYLDPPVAGPPRGLRRTPGLGRAHSRMDLAAVANGGGEEDEEMQSQTQASHAGSPPRAQSVRGRDFGQGLPSNSPFRAATPSSPSRFGSSLARAQTMRNIGRAESVASDVSMASASRSHVGGSLFGTPSRTRPTMDSRSNNIFAPRETTASIFGRDSTPRAGSADTTTFPPIRRGNMVYAGDKGFVRESELRAEEPPNRGANDAEKLLFALENRRNTPLQAARSSAVPFSQGGPFPHHLVGASTRQIRKEINVPLPTAHARETVRGTREKDLLEERIRGVSVLISPYGRRRAADEELRAARIADQQRRKEQERKDSESVYRPSSERELSIPRSTRRTRSVSSKLSDYDMDQEDVTMTPRRSARLKRGDRETSEGTTPKAGRTEKGKGKVSATPKKSGRAAATSPTETRRSTRKRTAERTTSPEPAKVASAAPSVPTITETAPSPQQGSKATSTSSGYQPRSANEGSREGSSLRTGREKTNRTHVGAASYTAKANTPGSGRFSALEDDLPDMDDLEESNKSNKIPANLFSGVSFGSMAPVASTPSAPVPAPAAPEQTAPSDSGSSLASRLGPQPAAGGLGVPRKGHLAKFESHKPRATSPLASAPINALPESPPQTIAPSKAPATAPAAPPAQSAGGFFSLSAPASGSTTPAGKPPATSLFSGLSATSAPSAPPAGNLFGSVEQPKKTAGAELGLGKPSSTPSEEKKDSAAPPSFFAPAPVAPIVPATSTGFNFGVSPSAPTAPPLLGSNTPPQSGASTPKAGSMFSFDSAKTSTTPAPAGASLFGAPKPAETTSSATTPAPFSFGAKPAEQAAKPGQPKSTFDFGSTAGDKPAEAPKPLFGGFGQSAPAEKKDEAPKVSLGGFGTTTAATAKADEPKSNAFGGDFGKPAAGASTSTGGSFGGFTGFGAATQSKDAPPTPAPVSGGMFGSAASASAPTSGTAAPSFTFGAPASSAAAPSTTASQAPASGGKFGGFGASKKRGAGESADEPPAKFGSQPGSPTTAAPAASTGFSFGSAMNGTSSSTSNSATGFGGPSSSSFSFSAPKPSTPSATPAANPFGAAATSAVTSSGPSFNFGASTNAAAPASAPGTPTTPSAGFNFSFGAASNAPAAGAAPSAPSTPFTFGASAPSSTTTPSFPPPANNTGFGAQNGFGQTNASNGFSAPSSGFGAAGGFGSTNTQSTGFTFGAAQPAAPAPSFGAAAPAQNGGGMFAFGAPSNGAPAAGQPQQQQPPPGSPGGFSMGAAGGAPGSPSGRMIKPLRSTRRAR